MVWHHALTYPPGGCKRGRGLEVASTGVQLPQIEQWHAAFLFQQEGVRVDACPPSSEGRKRKGLRMNPNSTPVPVIELGAFYQDQITGFVGRATKHARCLSGLEEVYLEPMCVNPGFVQTREWFDAQFLVLHSGDALTEAARRRVTRSAQA
jgi:hypothetical protein